MSRKRKVYSVSFRAQVALAAMRGDKTVNELATQFEVSPQCSKRGDGPAK